MGFVNYMNEYFNLSQAIADGVGVSGGGGGGAINWFLIIRKRNFFSFFVFWREKELKNTEWMCEK